MRREDRTGVQLIEVHGILDSQGTDGLAPERGQMGAHAESLSQVSGERPNVCTGAHLGAKRQIGGLVFDQINAVDRYPSRLQLHCLAPPRLAVAALAADLLSRKLRGPLQLLSFERCQLLEHPRPAD